MRFEGRERRHKRITKKMKGTALKPRLAVFRSSKNIYVQLINDADQKTVIAFSTISKEFSGPKTGNVQAAKEIGKVIAKKIMELGIKEIAFDRGGYKYHGRVKAVADGAREAGLKF